MKASLILEEQPTSEGQAAPSGVTGESSWTVYLVEASSSSMRFSFEIFDTPSSCNELFSSDKGIAHDESCSKGLHHTSEVYFLGYTVCTINILPSTCSVCVAARAFSL